MNTKNFEVIREDYDDLRFGIVNIYCDSFDHRLYMLKEKHSYNQMNHKIAVSMAKERRKLRHPNLLNMIDFKVDEENYIVSSYFEYPNEDIYQKQAELRNPQELLKFIHDILSAVAFLQDKQIIHGNLRPEYMYYSENEDRYVLLDRLADTSPPNTACLNNISNGQHLYMSPNIFNQLIAGESTIQHNPFKSEVFSVGMIVFSLLESEDELQRVYNKRTGKFNTKMLSGFINKAKDDLFYGGAFKRIGGFVVRNMLCVDENNRITPREGLRLLKEQLNDLMPVRRPKYNKRKEETTNGLNQKEIGENYSYNVLKKKQSYDIQMGLKLGGQEKIDENPPLAEEMDDSREISLMLNNNNQEEPENKEEETQEKLDDLSKINMKKMIENSLNSLIKKNYEIRPSLEEDKTKQEEEVKYIQSAMQTSTRSFKNFGISNKLIQTEDVDFEEEEEEEEAKDTEQVDDSLLKRVDQQIRDSERYINNNTENEQAKPEIEFQKKPAPKVIYETVQRNPKILTRRSPSPNVQRIRVHSRISQVKMNRSPSATRQESEVISFERSNVRSKSSVPQKPPVRRDNKLYGRLGLVFEDYYKPSQKAIENSRIRDGKSSYQTERVIRVSNTSGIPVKPQLSHTHIARGNNMYLPVKTQRDVRQSGYRSNYVQRGVNGSRIAPSQYLNPNSTKISRISNTSSTYSQNTRTRHQQGKVQVSNANYELIRNQDGSYSYKTINK